MWPNLLQWTLVNKNADKAKYRLMNTRFNSLSLYECIQVNKNFRIILQTLRSPGVPTNESLLHSLTKSVLIKTTGLSGLIQSLIHLSIDTPKPQLGMCSFPSETFSSAQCIFRW